MAKAYDLSNLDPGAFEHLVNMLALRVLGLGHTGFGPGPDGGRDGFFEGEAAYPSSTERWSGRWYIQSKFHAPHLSSDPQKWLIEEIRKELQAFARSDGKRRWPDNWIIATNIEPSGVPMTGAFDQANKLVETTRPNLAVRFHIWGGRKILDLLTLNPEIVKHYQHFLTPGYVISRIISDLQDAQAEIETIIRHLVVRQFGEQRFTKLQQAGSAADTRPGIHTAFIDLPFRAGEFGVEGLLAKFLVLASARNHKYEATVTDPHWSAWNRHPTRARVWFIKGGPGQGKSTVGQYLCQIQRAALILQGGSVRVTPRDRGIAQEIESVARAAKHWPAVPRIPILLELKEYAHWFGQQEKTSPRGVLTYLAQSLAVGVEQTVLVGTLKRALGQHSWLVVFDGLDEVPHDVKDAVASEVRRFIEDAWTDYSGDILSICTSRPQGYAGEFSELDGPTIELLPLSREQALACALPVIRFERTGEEVDKAINVLQEALNDRSVGELMKTPLQCHIMAVVVRDGNRPPQRRWQLFDNFYKVMKRREANRELPDEKLAKLLREDERLLKSVHNRLGFLLHARAETSGGAQTRLRRNEFRDLVKQAVMQMMEGTIEETVSTLMEATTVRLVLVSTPDDGEHVRFDIRSLQEFFAAEYIYEAVRSDELCMRMNIFLGDSHWREVSHFLISALVENGRDTELANALQVLAALDHGDEQLERWIFYRRLARGAIISARLLSEGVLEQDRRIRQQFHPCLEPICASTDSKVLQTLFSVSQPNSRQWLISFLLTVRNVSKSSECLGAATVLTYLLPDDHEASETVANFMLDVPIRDLNAILKGRLYKDPSEGEKTAPQQWLLRLFLNVLLGANWDQLDPEVFHYIYATLAVDPAAVAELARQQGYSDIVIELLRFALSAFGDDYHEDFEAKRYGIFTCEHLKWNIARDYAFWFPISCLPAQLEAIPGLLRVFVQAIRFKVSGDVADFKSLVEMVGSLHNREIISWLPMRLQSVFPFHFGRHIDDQLAEYSNPDFYNIKLVHKQGSFRGEGFMPPWASVEVLHEIDLERWRETVVKFPRMAAEYWAGIFWSGGEERTRLTKELHTPEYAEILADALCLQPVLAVEVAAVWGTLIKLLPARALELKQIFLKHSRSMAWRESYYRVFHPLKLVLPEDAGLLPPLWVAMVVGIPIISGTTQVERSEISTLAHECVYSAESLCNVSLNREMHRDVRVAAMMMLVAHNLPVNDFANDFDESAMLFDEILAEFDPDISWYVPTFVRLLNLSVSTPDSAAVRIVGKLILLVRESSADLGPIEALLSLWREQSTAPISTAGVVEQWLVPTTGLGEGGDLDKSTH